MDLSDRLGQKVQSGRAFFVAPQGGGWGFARPRPAKSCRGPGGGRRSNAVVAANNLGFEEAELGRELAVEVALTYAALRLDEAKVDVEAEEVLELAAHAIGEFTADEGASLLDHAADFAHQFWPRGTHFCDRFGPRLQRGHVILAALAHKARFGQRR